MNIFIHAHIHTEKMEWNIAESIPSAMSITDALKSYTYVPQSPISEPSTRDSELMNSQGCHSIFYVNSNAV